MTTASEIRKILGIKFCPTCGCDTMPLDRTGRCGWCDTLLSTPESGKDEAGVWVLWCDECDARIEVKSAPGVAFPTNRRFCTKWCKEKHWYRTTDAGRAWLVEKKRRRAVAQAAKVAARQGAQR